MADRQETILVVEDEVDLASLVEVNLDLAGYRVILAHDGAEGLTAARRERPDLILLDVMMPVLDGWQVLRALKEEDETRDIPVVMLTALSEERDLIRGHLQGAIRYVTKPFEMKALLTAVSDGIGEPSQEELERRRARVKSLLRRLAELDSGRTSQQTHVQVSRLEPVARAAPAPEASREDRTRLYALTEKQRYVADQMASGRSARDLADELGVSRSNVYATRKRIARKLGVLPDDVPTEARRLGLGTSS